MFTPLTAEEFRQRTGLDVDLFSPLKEPVQVVTSLRSLKKIQCVPAMRTGYLRRLMASVTLVGDPDTHPYAGCEFSRVRMDTRMLLVGQTFVENAKLLALADIDDIFEGQDLPFGISKKGCSLAYGRDVEGRVAVAQYLPPIVEWTGGYHRLLDGLHRCRLTMAAGTTIEVLKIHHVATPFPCETRKWSDVKRVDRKPPKDERFFGLQEDLFRDLKRVGIDG